MSEIQIKTCVVCGDTAKFRNFGALTCKSCKPFFRRNAYKRETFKCKSGGNCPVNQFTRKKCRKCRIDKCFAVGMIKELIRNDVEIPVKYLIEEKRKDKCEDKQNVNQINDSEVNKIPESLVLTNSCHSINCSENQLLIDKNDSIKHSNCVFSSEISIYNQNIETDINEDQMSEIECFLTITEAIRKSSQLYHATFDFVSKSLTICRPFLNYEQNYSESEKYKLTELFHIFQPFSSWNRSIELIMINSIIETPQPNNIFYERGIRSLIESTKRMNDFQNICENDRIALVKYSSIDIILLRSIECFDLINESWIIEMDKERAFMMKLGLLKTFKCDVYLNYKNYLNNIIKECDSDSTVLCLLIAIALFNPNRSNLINQELVKVQQQVYLHLLQRYLTFKYRNKSYSEIKFAKLLNTLINAHILSRIERKYFVEGYEEQYCPLVKEVFDL